MPDQNGDLPGYSQAALGDSGPWTWFLPPAWHGVVDPTPPHQIPYAPPQSGKTYLRPHDEHYYRIAYWSPLLHLTFFGLGWQRPDRGLLRWLQEGQPTDNPILAQIDRWWGPSVEQFIAWAATPTNSYSGFLNILADVDGGSGLRTDRTVLPDQWREMRETPSWQETWGVGDSMHIGHATSPVHPSYAALASEAPGLEIVMPDPARQLHAVLLLDQYAGWYRHLLDLGAKLPQRTDGRSWRVDVVVRPLGFLGSYRHSWKSGRWFSGRHRVHEMGLANALD